MGATAAGLEDAVIAETPFGAKLGGEEAVHSGTRAQ